MIRLMVTAIVLGAVPTSLMLSPDATPRGDALKVWKDQNGWIIKRLEPDGTLILITRDMKGRIVEMAQVEGRFTAKTAVGGTTAGYAWVHRFEYGETGQLAGEIDCAGTSHAFGHKDGHKFNERRGTALAGHRHLPEGKNPR